MKEEAKVLKLIKYGIYLISSISQIIINTLALINGDAILVTALYILAIITVLEIIGKDYKPDYKIPWILFILILPIGGMISYFLFGKFGAAYDFSRQSEELESSKEYEVTPSSGVTPKNSNESIKSDIEFISKTSNHPVYKNTKTNYFSCSTDMFDQMLMDMKSAAKFIFLEYPAFGRDGSSFKRFYEVLMDKAIEGIEIIIIYDSALSFLHIKKKLNELKKYNIKFCSFSPPLFSLNIGCRDHRNLCIIDGDIAYCCGISMGDEYISGEKKDTALKLSGDAVFSFTVMFIRTYVLMSGEKKDINLYRPELSFKYCLGYTVPYYSSPLENENNIESLYRKVIFGAKDYVYINTPCLEINHVFASDLKTAARSGVDVKIITPFITEENFFQRLTRSFYGELLDAGVKIYEYAPGFINSNQIISDDIKAVVGSAEINSEGFRRNFEYIVYVSNEDTVSSIKQDFLKTLESCVEIRTEDYKNNNPVKDFVQKIIRLIAPLV